MAQNQTTEEKLREFRIEQYLDMRFTSKEAAALADATQNNGFPLDYKRVRKAILDGCTHKMAVQIFT